MRRSLCPNASCNAGFIRNAAQQKARQKDTGEGKPDGPTEPGVTGAAPPPDRPLGPPRQN